MKNFQNLSFDVLLEKCAEFGPHHCLHINCVCAAVVAEKTLENKIAIIWHQISALNHHHAAAVNVSHRVQFVCCRNVTHNGAKMASPARPVRRKLITLHRKNRKNICDFEATNTRAVLAIAQCCEFRFFICVWYLCFLRRWCASHWKWSRFLVYD